MRIIKNYEQYIKENKKVNEDIEEFDDVPENEMDSDDPLNQGIEEETPEFTDEMPEGDLPPTEIDIDEEVPTIENEFEEEGEGEEEGHQYKGNQMIAKLADILGTEPTGNSIEYNGKRINFFSETEMYHVDRKKFATAEEVAEYLNSTGEQPSEVTNEPIAAEPMEEPMGEPMEPISSEEEVGEPMMMGESKSHKSYRKTRKFESFRNK